MTRAPSAARQVCAIFPFKCVTFHHSTECWHVVLSHEQLLDLVTSIKDLSKSYRFACVAAGELWENAVHAQGAPTDSYRWGRVNVPTSHGKVIQVSAGDCQLP